MLTTRRTKNGWAIYRGRRLYLTTRYGSKAGAERRIQTENKWRGGSFYISRSSQ